MERLQDLISGPRAALVEYTTDDNGHVNFLFIAPYSQIDLQGLVARLCRPHLLGHGEQDRIDVQLSVVQQFFPVSQRSATRVSYCFIVSWKRRSSKLELDLSFFFRPHCFFKPSVHRPRSCRTLFIPFGLPTSSGRIGISVPQSLSPSRKTILCSIPPPILCCA
jgi:hypothetical protein